MSDATVSEPGHRLKPLTPAMLRELSARSNLRGPRKASAITAWSCWSAR